MPSYETVLVDIDGAVATITLNRPEKLNAISDPLRRDLRQALDDLDPGDRVRVIRLKGAGRAFCAGYDLLATPGDGVELADTQAHGDAPWEMGESRIAQDRDMMRKLAHYWLDIWGYRKPIVAQVQGYCLAGGGEMIGACDVVFAATDARFGHPAGRAMGIPVTLGLWPARVGMLKAKELLFSGDMIDGIEAEKIGMVNRALPPDQLEEVTMAFCRRISQVPLDALTVHKAVVNRWFENMGLRTSVDNGADLNSIYHETPSMKAFFDRVKARGLKEALAWRDKPFGDGRGGR